MMNFFNLLCDICKKYGYPIPLSEEMLVTDSMVLNYYLDDVLVLELISHGLGTDDEPNEYGVKIEEAIDYFNRLRLKKAGETYGTGDGFA